MKSFCHSTSASKSLPEWTLLNISIYIFSYSDSDSLSIMAVESCRVNQDNVLVRCCTPCILKLRVVYLYIVYYQQESYSYLHNLLPSMCLQRIFEWISVFLTLHQKYQKLNSSAFQQFFSLLNQIIIIKVQPSE